MNQLIGCETGAVKQILVPPWQNKILTNNKKGYKGKSPKECSVMKNCVANICSGHSNIQVLLYRWHCVATVHYLN